MELLSLSSLRRGTADASVQRVVNENITINAVKFLTLWALKKILVDVHERPLTSEAVRFLPLVGDFYEVCDGEEMVIRSGEMGGENQC